MRILKPETAQERENKILQLIVEYFVQTKRPVGSELIAQEGNVGVSSATIRNIMKKLEDKGYLVQGHTSGGRIPTDKAYRFYVDYLSDIQKFALEEKQNIEDQYQREMTEIDKLMLQTSKILSSISKSAGFVYSPSAAGQCVKRLDFLPLGPKVLLAVLVTDSGSVHHWSFRVPYELTTQRIRLLSSYINQEIAGLPLNQARERLWKRLSGDNPDLRDISDVARQFLSDLQKHEVEMEDLYIDGLGQLLDDSGSTDYPQLRELLNVVEEKQRFSSMLNERFRDFATGDNDRKVQISIGSENEMEELKDLSIVTSSYRCGDKLVGLLGIMGPKHMEYPRMMSLVNFVSDVLEVSLKNWEKLIFEKNSEDFDNEENY
jgi:heat-inducible transcriptional repressor